MLDWAPGLYIGRVATKTVLERLLTAAEVGEIVGTTGKTVTNWAKARQIPGVELPGRHWRFRRESIDAWLSECETPAPSKAAGRSSHRPRARAS